MRYPVPDEPFPEDLKQDTTIVEPTCSQIIENGQLCASPSTELDIFAFQSLQLDAETASSTIPFPPAPLDLLPSHDYLRTDFPFLPSHPHLHYPAHRRRRKTRLLGLFPSVRHKIEGRPRIHSLEPEPLPEPWTFPGSKRFRPGPDFRPDLTPHDISTMVTSGYLLVDDIGIQWADTRVYFLIEIKADMPVPVPVPAAEGISPLTKERIMSAAVERYVVEEAVTVPTEKPVTPIVEKDDPISMSAPTTPMGEKKVRFDSKRLSLDLASGREESGVVMDNEGKTAKAWWNR